MKKPSKIDQPYDKSVFQSLLLISQFGINMIVPILMMSALGLMLDKHLQTRFCVVLFFVIGAIAGAQNVYRMAKKIYENDDQKENKA